MPLRRAPLPALLAGLLLSLAAVAAGEDHGVEVAWRLGRSDFVRYERVSVRTKDGKEHRGGARVVTVHGHDLGNGSERGRGQYEPASPVLDDLVQILALRLVDRLEQKSAVKFDWDPRAAAPVRIKGTVTIQEIGPRYVELVGAYDLKGRGKPEQGDRWQIKSGTARTKITWDGKEGVVTKARIEIDYVRRDLQRKGRAAQKEIERVCELTLKSLRRMRPDDFQQSVDQAIERGVAHLRALQRKDGTFKPHDDWEIGTTALATFALLSCGVPRDDPQLERALDWIFEQDPERTYDLAACLLAINRAYTPEKELAAMRRGLPVEKHERDLPAKRMAWVLRAAEDLKNAASSPGTWGYPAKGATRLHYDTSNTQYAVLGMRAAVQLGYAVDERTWIGVLRYCELARERQGPKGVVSIVRRGQAIPDEATAHKLYEVRVPEVAGFRYSNVESHNHVSGSMTCAGISCLLIARHELLRVDCKKLSPKLAKGVDAMIHGAWAWLDAHWAMDRHPEHPKERWYYYYLYCLERAGMLDGIKRIGGRDWYFEGAAQLIARQRENGSWNHKGLSTWGGSGWSDTWKDETPPTCFALLFLKQGTAPLSGTITCK